MSNETAAVVGEGAVSVEHSPAPWRWVSDVRTQAQDRDLFTMRFLIAAGGQGFALTVGLGPAVDSANADLIAAAPDLLAACEWVVALNLSSATKDVLNAAISKARGLNTDATPTAAISESRDTGKTLREDDAG